MDERKQMIIKHLKERYTETGKDFYFKSRQLHDIDLDSRVIGRTVFSLADDGLVKIINPDRTGKSHTFLTRFKNNLNVTEFLGNNPMELQK